MRQSSNLLTRAFTIPTHGIVALVASSAWCLRTTRLGRLLYAVSLPRLREHRLRTTLTVLGIALGVGMLVAVLIVNESVVRGVSGTVRDLAGNTDLQISAGASGIAETLLDTVRQTPGVQRAVPALQQTVSIRDSRARGERLLLLGVDLLSEDDAQLRDYGSAELEEIRKDPLVFLNSTHNILLNREVAQRRGYGLHDSIDLATSDGVQRFEIWGFITDRGIAHAFGGAVAVMYYQAMQLAFTRGQNIDRIDLTLRAPAQLSVVQASLRDRLGGGFVVEPPAQSGERVGRMLFGVQSGLTIASLIALLVGAFLIHNTMMISVVQRTAEIGILRALGSRRRDVVALLTLEGALLGVVGSLLGVALGTALSSLLLRATTDALNQTYLEVGTATVALPPYALLAGFALGTLAATLASAQPARRAARQDPALTLRSAALVAPSRSRPTRDVPGVLLLLAAGLLPQLPATAGVAIGAMAAAASLLAAFTLLLPRWIQLAARTSAPLLRFLSVEARLASESLPRDLGRTSVSAGALMAGVALAVGFGTFTHSFTVSLTQWIYETLPGDLFITQSASLGGTSSRNVPMNLSLNGALRALPEVESMRRTRIVDLPYRGYNIKAVATDLNAYLQRARLNLLEGETHAVVNALRDGQIAVSENFSRHFGTHPGGDVELATESGTRRFRVAGVYVDYTSDVGTVLFGRDTYVQMFRDERVDTYELYLHASANAQDVRRKVLALASDRYDLNVLTSAEFRAAIHDTTAGIFGLVRVLELVALIVAVLGIINTQYANVLDRKRELAVLRALGMLRKQLGRMVMIESALVGAAGSCAGVILGLWFGHLLLQHINVVQTGWYFPFRISVASIVEATTLTLVAATLAGLYPAVQAARLNITQALAAE